ASSGSSPRLTPTCRSRTAARSVALAIAFQAVQNQPNDPPAAPIPSLTGTVAPMGRGGFFSPRQMNLVAEDRLSDTGTTLKRCPISPQDGDAKSVQELDPQLTKRAVGYDAEVVSGVPVEESVFKKLGDRRADSSGFRRWANRLRLENDP